MTIFRKIRKLVATLRVYYWPSDLEKILHAFYLRRAPATRAPENAPTIALQCCADLLYFAVFGEIITALRQRLPLHADQYVLSSLRLGESHFPTGFLWANLFENRWSSKRWQWLYSAYCDRVAVRSAALLSPLMELRIWLQAYRLWRTKRSKDEFAALTVRGVLIGDLVIDSFLRFKPEPSFKAEDRYVFRILRQALREIEKAYAYFGARKPKLYLTSYTSYIQHGIPARVAVTLGIRTFSFGNYQEVCKLLSLEDQTHLAEHWNYPARFHALAPSEQQARREAADEKLALRMRGEIDNAIGYMRQSAYAASSTEVPDVRGKVIVYLPDFYDSIHVYRWTVFHDFWEWACFTIDTLTAAGIPFLLKGHPNAYEDSKLVYERLRARYPDVGFVPEGVTTAQLADAGIAAGVSPRGTVLSELAYLGVPVIAGGDHPHAEFDLEPPPRTVDDYRRRLIGALDLATDAALMRQRACEFYAMHNLLPDPADIALRSRWLEMRAITATYEALATVSPETMMASFEALSREPAFRRQIAEWLNYLLPQPAERTTPPPQPATATSTAA